MISALFLLVALIQPPALPDLQHFLEITRSRLSQQLDESGQLKGYAFRSRTIRDSDVAEYDRFQFDQGLYEKLISRNGIPLAQTELQKRKAGPLLAPKSPQDLVAIIDDMFKVWTFEMAGRQTVRGRSAIVIAFEPLKDARPKTAAGKWLFRNSKGVVWVDEEDHSIVRMRFELINDISLKWGLGRIRKGTEILREWEKVDDEAWLPSLSITHVRARSFMVGVSFHEIEQYFDYRKLDVATKLQSNSPR